MKIAKISYILDDEDKRSIRKKMVDKDITLKQLADTLGVSVGYISDILNGKKVITSKIIDSFTNCEIFFNRKEQKKRMQGLSDYLEKTIDMLQYHISPNDNSLYIIDRKVLDGGLKYLYNLAKDIEGLCVMQYITIDANKIANNYKE